MTEIPGVCQNPIEFSSFQFPNKRTWKSAYKKNKQTNNNNNITTIKLNKKQTTSCMI